MTEAAYIDGANDIQILTRLILPLSKSVLAVLVLYYAVIVCGSVPMVILVPVRAEILCQGRDDWLY